MPAADRASGLRWARQRVVRALDGGQPRQDLGRHRRRAACRSAYVQRHQLVGGGQPTLTAVVHRVEVLDALVVVGEQPRREAQRIAGSDLAMVGHVRLQTERRDCARGAVRGVEPHPGEELVGRVVEDDEVVAHVHVLVVIDPLRPHDVAVAVEGRREIRHRA